eukprot:Nitzschia sp. Nitz4//scaffold99_size76975//28182//29987//NITZ4_005573-RA/size76975-processed-gene-0.48-mRNA-1//1//CDS//3329560841//8828//frame0
MSSAAEFTVESSDIIRLMLGYLTSVGLHHSAKVLRQESGVGFSSGTRISPALSLQIAQGDWGNVLRALLLYQDSQPLVTEQVILELAERDATMQMAYSLLTLQRHDLDQIEDDVGAIDTPGMAAISKARSLEQKLAAISADSKLAEGQPARLQKLYGPNGNRQARRDALVKLVDDQLSAEPIQLDRLATLIQQSCKWQSLTGQLPWIQDAVAGEDMSAPGKKRRRLDLVQGVPAGNSQRKNKSAVVVGDTEDKNSDKPTLYDNLAARVKFGKSVYCEAACFVTAGMGGLVTASSDGLIEIWDSTYQALNVAAYPFQKSTVMGHSTTILSMTLSSDQALLASGDSAGKVKVWKLDSGKCLRQYQAHENAGITCLAFPKDASRLLTGSSNGTCREFGLVSQHVLQEYTGHVSYIHTCQYILDFRNDDYPTQWVVTSSADGTVRLWQHGQSLQIWQPSLNTPSLVVDPTGVLPESPAIHTVLTIPSKNQVVVVPRSSTAYIVSMNGSVVHTLSTNKPDVTFVAAAVCHNGIYLATTSNDCWVFGLDGRWIHTIAEFGSDSTSKTTGSSSKYAEVSQMIHHPTQPVLVAFSNDKTQKKGILAVWK